MKLQNILLNKFSIVLLQALFLLSLSSVHAAQGKIVFTSARDGGDNIYVMNDDGTLPTKLSLDGSNLDPSVTADGSRIVFTSWRDNTSEIYIMNGDGSGETRLTNNFSNDIDARISPDGSRIVFLSDRSGFYQIYLMNSDGSNPTLLTNGTQPSFSPDGSKIVYAGYDGISLEIFTINLDGTNKTQITMNPASDRHPVFSPDGSRIAFSTDRDGDNAFYVMNADGTNQTRVTGINVLDDFYRQSSFSPDGSRIVFVDNRDGNLELYTIGIDGSNLLRITNNPAADFNPVWFGLLPAVPPAAPTNLRVDYVGANQINLRWTDNSDNESGFIIEQCRNKNCTNNIQIGQTEANAATYLIAALLSNTQYSYRVRAFNDSGRSDSSNVVMVKTLRR